MKLTGLEILRTPMDDNDADAETIGDYLVSLAFGAWEAGKGLAVNAPSVTLAGSTKSFKVCVRRTLKGLRLNGTRMSKTLTTKN